MVILNKQSPMEINRQCKIKHYNIVVIYLCGLTHFEKNEWCNGNDFLIAEWTLQFKIQCFLMYGRKISC